MICVGRLSACHVPPPRHSSSNSTSAHTSASPTSPIPLSVSGIALSLISPYLNIAAIKSLALLAPLAPLVPLAPLAPLDSSAASASGDVSGSAGRGVKLTAWGWLAAGSAPFSRQRLLELLAEGSVA